MLKEQYNELEVKELFTNVMNEVDSATQKFIKTLGYKQLTYKEQQATVKIINHFGEFMFDFHLESMEMWSKESLEDVMISIFPNRIVANLTFFEKIAPVLVKFFEFLYYSEKLTTGLELANSVKRINFLMLNEVQVLLKDSDEEKLFHFGEELGLDMSDLNDLDRLFHLVSLFEEPKKRPPLKLLISQP